MAERKFEINKRTFIKKCSLAVILGSLIPAWLFIVANYFSTINSQGYYSAPASAFAMQLLCLPIFVYQLPTYIISGIVGLSFVKWGIIKPGFTAYLGIGSIGWFVSTLFLTIMSVNGTDYPAPLAAGVAFLESLPTLLLYLVFLFPKPLEY